MKIDFISDLHVDSHFHETTPVYEKGKGPQHFNSRGEFQYFDFEWFKTPDSSVLVIAGDISNNIAVSCKVLEQASEHYDFVIFTDGNHEHYNLSITYMPCVDIETTNNVFDNIDIIKEFIKSNPKLIYLDGVENLHFTLDNITFLGGNSWYDWSALIPYGYSYEDNYKAWQTHMKDAKRIDFKYVNPEVLANEFASDVEKFLKTNTNEIVLVTHTSPLVLLHSIIPGNFDYNALTSSFINSKLADVLDENVKTCLYGHTHDHKDLVLSNTRFVNNAYGYPHEFKKRGWKMKQITIGE